MNVFQKEVLVGCCLGDISIHQYGSGKSRFQICHTDKQRDYTDHKYEIFKDLCNTPPKTRCLHYPVRYFNSLSSKAISEVTDMFWQENVRRVPQNIKEILTDVGLTYWFMDDGTCVYTSLNKYTIIRNSTIQLATDRYCKEDVELLIEVLDSKFGIKSTIKYSPSMRCKDGRQRYRIYIGTRETPKFLDIIEQRIFDNVPCMSYKIKRQYTHSI